MDINLGPDRRLLKTFIQISDLHVGEIDARSGDAQVSPRAGYMFQNFTWFDGLLGHHGTALKELQQFCEEFHQANEPFEVLVTGDLTRCGASNEILTVQNLLSAQIDMHPPARNFVGLGLGSVPPASITGNHDQWGGINSPRGGGPLPARRLVPNALPYVLPQKLANGRRLIVAGIDTDSKVGPRGMKRVLAMGSFQDQVVTLQSMLPAFEQGDIRILLAHHSFARTGLLLRMDSASKAALEAFLANNGFRVLLSGHTHKQLYTDFHAASSQNSSLVSEMTCGSTTQHDQVPYAWRNILGRLPSRQWIPNSLLVHRIVATPGATTWEAQAYTRTKMGFGTLGVHFERRVAL